MAILNLTNSQIEKDSENTDVRKMQQEALMSKKLSTLFRRIASDFKVFYTATGTIPDLSLYENNLNEILMNGYRNSASYFKNNMKRLLTISLKQEKDLDQKEEIKDVLDIRNEKDAAILASLLLMFNERKDAQTAFILDTTEDVIQKNLMNTLIDNPDASQAEIASKAAEKIKEENINRSGTIAETETQWAAETSKAEETNILKTSTMAAGITLLPQKRWTTVLDSKTREEHRVANGQRRPTAQAYEVGGQSLRFPGDTSLGASLWNVINCRCQSYIEI